MANFWSNYLVRNINILRKKDVKRYNFFLLINVQAIDQNGQNYGKLIVNEQNLSIRDYYIVDFAA